MSEPTRPNGAGLSERGQEPYADIPTDPDAFMHWAAGLTGDDGYKYELSRGKVIRNDRLKDLACEAPILIVEVLSPSTAVLDVTTKQREYTAIPSLKTYLVCSQDEPRTWAWARKADGSFPIDADEFVGRDDTIPLGGLDIELSMAAIFRGIPDAPTL